MKLPGLVKVLAEGDERGEATLNHIARVIREAGHLPTTKRGPGASDMGLREAANLLIAANGSDAPAMSGVAVEQYRHLAFAKSIRRSFDLDASDWWTSLKAAPDFGSALELFLSPKDQDLGDVKRSYEHELEIGPVLKLHRNVRFVRPELKASLVLLFSRDGDELAAIQQGGHFELVFAERPDQPPQGSSHPRAHGRIVAVTVRERTIGMLTSACSAKIVTAEV